MMRYVLGSRSPRRRELLQQIVPADRIDIVPPTSSEEAGFDGLTDWPSIRARMQEITRHKSTQVLGQLAAAADNAVVICADTSIIITEVGSNDASSCATGSANVSSLKAGVGVEKTLAEPVAHNTECVSTTECPLLEPLRVIGQPPSDEPRGETVRQWYRDFYAGRTHLAATSLRVIAPDQRVIERIVTTRVTFRRDIDPWFDWYLASGEPQGKAGGYAVQGAGSIFMTSIVGSLTNVIGLPLEALLEALWELGVVESGESRV